MAPKKIALFVEDNYNDLEFWYPYYRMKEEGYQVSIIGTGNREKFTSKQGLVAQINLSSSQVNTAEFDAVIIPGGYAPDKMRIDPDMLRIVREMNSTGKVVASICHAGWVLVSAGVLKGKQATACSMIKDDLVNAGAAYLDQEVVVDGNIITSRVPDDLPAFCREILKKLK